MVCDPMVAINQPQVSIIVAGYSKSSRWVWCGLLYRRLAIFDMRVSRLAAINFNMTILCRPALRLIRLGGTCVMLA